MLKTISHNEFVHFLKIMKEYYNHMLGYPHTMIARFFGLHKIKFSDEGKTKRIYFVIMANVFNTDKEIHLRYDLKGSTQGRFTKRDPDSKLDSKVCYKDLDWIADE
jgi:1-phosphatidylinositol-4-phosphate 5-kinase